MLQKHVRTHVYGTCVLTAWYIGAAIACLTVMSLDQSISEQEKMLDRKILYKRHINTFNTEGIYPAAESSNEKRVIRKKSKEFSLHHGELFYKRTNRGRRGSKVNIYNVYSSP